MGESKAAALKLWVVLARAFAAVQQRAAAETLEQVLSALEPQDQKEMIRMLKQLGMHAAREPA